MKLSTKTRYGLRALSNILGQSQDCCCSVKQISDEEHISYDYLEKIFSKLKKAGILKVERGATGGYSLNRDPQKITLKEVVNALEKAEFTCPDFCSCQSKSVWQKIQFGFNNVLSSITLNQLVDSKDKSIYFDYAASTPVDPEVLNTMLPYFDSSFSGNTMSLHQMGTSSSQIVETCRQTFANILKVKPQEIIFTSSATESNNTVIKGVAQANKTKGKHIIISSIEHDCVLESANWLKTQGFEISQISVDKYGLINLDELRKTIRKDTILVSIIHGNNEIGTIQDIQSIGQICHDRGVYFHTDASQSFTKVPLDLSILNVDLLTASSHKIYGPKGSALLYIKSGTNITPLLHGGGHEFGLRSSTLNLPAIVGFTKAAEIAIKNFDQENDRLSKLRDYLIKNIDVIGVTLGPGLAIALGIGVNKAKELAVKYNKKLVAVNHIEGHIWANLLKNKNGKPEKKVDFPALVLTVSGGHTKLVLIKEVGKYEVVGETLDDAAGEALDKAAKMLGLGYPGGPIIEILAKTGDVNFLDLPRPLADKKILDYSFSGLKTSFYYKIKTWPAEKIFKNINNLAATFQNAVFETLLRKYKLAIEKHQPRTLLASGGVLSNLELRKRLRKMAKEMNIPLLMPVHKNLNTDNAAMIGIVAYQKALRGEFVEDIDKLDRNPRMQINY